MVDMITVVGVVINHDGGTEPDRLVVASPLPAVSILPTGEFVVRPAGEKTGAGGAFSLSMVYVPGAVYRIQTSPRALLPNGIELRCDDYDPGQTVQLEDLPRAVSPTAIPAYTTAELRAGLVAYIDTVLADLPGGGTGDVTQAELGVEAQARSDGDTELAADLATHAADTTGVHGIADTAALALLTDPRFTNARPPTVHGHVIADTAGLQVALDGKALVGHGHTSGAITDWNEAVQDALATFFNVTGATFTYNDAGNEMTVVVPLDTNTTDPEQVRDAIGAALVGVGNIGVAIDDAGNTITLTTTATVNATDAALRDRGLHTGTQPISSVTSLQAALDALTTAVAGRAAALGADDNYVTDAQLAALHTHPAVIAQGTTQALARAAIGAGTSSFDGVYGSLSSKPTLGTAAAKNTGSGAGDVATGNHAHANPAAYVIASVDTPNSTVTAADATGLAVPALADGTWEFEVFAICSSVLQTTGAQVGIGTPPAGATVYVGGVATGANSAALSGFWPSLSQLPYSSPSGGAAAANSPYVGALYKGIIVAAGMAGPLAVTIRSKVAASEVTIKAGSFVKYWKVG